MLSGTPLSAEKFAEVLKKVLIIDTSFENFNHGVYIHMLQYDMMVHFARSRGLDPQIVRDFLQWMGSNERIQPEDFSTLDVWQNMFDSLGNVIWASESQNITIFKEFLRGWSNKRQKQNQSLLVCFEGLSIK